MSDEYFKRQISITVEPMDPLDGLDCTFHIEKSLSPKHPNTIDLRVFNLSKDTRGALNNLKQVTVTIKAGYGEREDIHGLPVIFYGDVRNIFHQTDGPDWITYITSGDGGVVNSQARSSQSFSTGTFYKDVLSKLLDDIDASGIGTKNARAAIANPKVNPSISKQFKKGTAVSGSSIDQFDSLARSCGMEVSVQNRQIQVLKRGSALSIDVVVLSPESGLIGSPQQDLKKIVKARSLLNGNIQPGVIVRIESFQFQGFFKVSKATYIGDTSGNDWFVDIECKAVNIDGSKT